MYYLFNSHLAPASEWRKLLASEGSQSVRGTPYDGFFIGLLIDVHHKVEITRSHFDGNNFQLCSSHIVIIFITAFLLLIGFILLGSLVCRAY